MSSGEMPARARKVAGSRSSMGAPLRRKRMELDPGMDRHGPGNERPSCFGLHLPWSRVTWHWACLKKVRFRRRSSGYDDALGFGARSTLAEASVRLVAVRDTFASENDRPWWTSAFSAAACGRRGARISPSWEEDVADCPRGRRVNATASASCPRGPGCPRRRGADQVVERARCLAVPTGGQRRRCRPRRSHLASMSKRAHARVSTDTTACSVALP